MRFPVLIGPRFAVFAQITAMLSMIGLAACDTEDQLAQQRLDAVKRERAMLATLSDAVKRGDLKADGTTASLFISSGMVNQALAGLSGVKVELPNTSGAILTVKRAAADFKTGFPGLILDAWVERSGVRISAAIVAMLEVAPDDAKPDVLSLKVHIDSLVPSVHWGPFDFGIRGLVRDIGQVRLDNLVNGPGVLGRIAIPLSRAFPLHLPAYAAEVNLPGAKVTISAPALDLVVKTRIERVLFLRDGIHVFARASV